MTPLDWGIVFGYLAGMVALSAWLARGQRSARDYYLAGNRIGPLPVALSVLATQSSTNSLLGIPALVAFTAGAGFHFMQWEIALPLAAIVLMAWFYPTFRQLRLISLYEYVERRFGLATRTVLSLTFQLLRAFGTGVTVYGFGLVISLVLGVNFGAAVAVVMGVTILYDVLGGMRGVIWSDVIQLVLIVAAVLGAIAVAISLVGGVGSVFSLVPAARFEGVHWGGHGLGDGATFGFLPVLIGGFFLYVSYYGCDQTQAQRLLSTRSPEEAERAIYFSGLLRFPLGMLYGVLGLCLAAYAAAHPEFLDELKTGSPDGAPQYNLAVPVFVLKHFPPGAVGLVIVGMFAAAMSSLDSTLNSLSALTMRDVLDRLLGWKLSPRGELWASKSVTAFWGILCLIFSFFVGGISDTVVESVNKVTSLLAGPMLAVFTLGLFVRRANEKGALVGLLTGGATNAALWIFAPSVSWLWWNVAGWLAGMVTGLITSLLTRAPDPSKLDGTLAGWTVGGNRHRVLVLAALAGGLLVFLSLTGWLAGLMGAG